MLSTFVMVVVMVAVVVFVVAMVVGIVRVECSAVGRNKQMCPTMF